MVSFYILISFSIIKLNQSVLFVVGFWCGKEDNHSLLLQRSLHRFNYCNVCTVFAAYELNGSKFLQASVEFGLSTEKVSLKLSLLSPFLFICSVFTYWYVFRLFELVDWCNLSNDSLLHCFFLFIIEGHGLSLVSWKLVSLFVIYTQKSIFYVLFCIISNCMTFREKWFLLL